MEYFFFFYKVVQMRRVYKCNIDFHLPVLGYEFSIRSPYGAGVVQLLVASLRYRTTNHIDIVLSRRLGQRRARLALRNALGISRKVSYLFYQRVNIQRDKRVNSRIYLYNIYIHFAQKTVISLGDEISLHTHNVDVLLSTLL